MRVRAGVSVVVIDRPRREVVDAGFDVRRVEEFDAGFEMNNVHGNLLK